VVLQKRRELRFRAQLRDREMAASPHGGTPHFGKPVTSESVTPYITSVGVNPLYGFFR